MRAFFAFLVGALVAAFVVAVVLFALGRGEGAEGEDPLPATRARVHNP